MLQFAFSLMTVALVATAERYCDAGWSMTPNRDRCVQVSSQPLLQPQALTACQGMQGTLVSIHNELDNNFIWNLTSQMPNVTFGAWIGGHTDTPKANQTTGWTWASGEPWDYARWQPGKPDNWQGCPAFGVPDVNQQCVEMWLYYSSMDNDSIHVSYWNDQCCHRPLSFICEKHPANKAVMLNGIMTSLIMFVTTNLSMKLFLNH